MSRKPRKLKIKPIQYLWEMEDKGLDSLIQHLGNNFPNSGALKSYLSEQGRRNDGISVEDFYKVDSEE